MRENWIPGISTNFLRSGNGLRFYWYERVRRIWQADEKGTKKMGKVWKESPHLMILELERQFETLSGSPKRYVIESDAFARIYGFKEYAPGKAILTTQTINRFWASLDKPFIDDQNKHRGITKTLNNKNPYKSDPKMEAKRKGSSSFPTEEDAAIHFEESQIKYIDLWISRLKTEPSKYCGDPGRMIEAFEFEKRRIESWILQLSQNVPSLWGAA